MFAEWTAFPLCSMSTGIDFINNYEAIIYNINNIKIINNSPLEAFLLNYLVPPGFLETFVLNFFTQG